jgi:hypothetical protein
MLKIILPHIGGMPLQLTDYSGKTINEASSFMLKSDPIGANQ